MNNKIEETLDDLFPKGEKSRGNALVLAAVAQIELGKAVSAERERCVDKVINEGKIAFVNTDDDIQIEWIKTIVDLSVKAIREEK